MKAIVLTYDKYHPLTDHMIDCYQELWPDNPLTFRVPFQNSSNLLKDKYGDKIELIKTDSSIRSTVLKLIEDLDDNEWIFWCIDDKYPIKLNIQDMTSLYRWLTQDKPDVSGIMYSFKKRIMKEKHIHKQPAYLNPKLEYEFFKKKDYSMIWIHQFVQVKVIRYLFENFPEKISSAKEMDYLKKEIKLPDDHKLYVLDKSIAEYGESTHRGLITKNCAESFNKKRIELPEIFKITSKEIFMGSEKYEQSSFITLLKSVLKKLKFNLIE